MCAIWTKWSLGSQRSAIIEPNPPEERAAASDIPPVPMEPAAARKMRERVLLETKCMIGSVEKNAERYERFLEENPIITADPYPPILK